jgi:ribosomal-protein-alanine N-acetyltransferase
MPVRRGQPSDLALVAAIQDASPEAARWHVADYLQYDFLVSEHQEQLDGFAVWRTVAPGEHELLNLAVGPDRRRRGVGRSLIAALLAASPGTVFLEVRESNQIARRFYKSMGFHEVSVRHGYYESPPEAAIVMKFHPC